jgi:Na+/melibiose symporter-like transporter
MSLLAKEKYLFPIPKNGRLFARFKKDDKNKLYLSKGEVIALNGRAGGLGCWSGMTSTYRTMFITSVLFAGFDYQTEIVSRMVIITILSSIIEFVVYPIAGMMISRTRTRIGRYRPYGLLLTLPLSLSGALMFISPPGMDLQQKIIYVTVVTSAFNVFNLFINLAFNLVQVNTPNDKERGKWIAFSGIMQTIGSAVPLGAFKVLSYFIPEASVFTVLGIMFAVVMMVTYYMFFGLCKERVEYTNKKLNIKTGVLDPYRHKPFLIYTIAQLLRTFAAFTGIATPFLAAVVLGAENAILFSLPTGAGTAFGLVLCNIMIRKVKPLYLIRGIGFYSAAVGLALTVVGPFAGIPFYILYFMYGITYGFHNVLPNVIVADIYDYLEWKTGFRLEVSGTILSNYLQKGVTTLRDSLFVVMLAWAGYKVPQAAGETIYQANLANQQSVGRILMFYAVGIPGIFFLIISILYFFIDIEGKKKEEMRQALVEMRKRYKAENPSEAA